MKLGFWNRLAIVATVLVVGIAPITIMVKQREDVLALVNTNYDLCMDAARQGPLDRLRAAYDVCEERMSAGYDRASDEAYSWSNWAALATGSLFLCVASYVLIWAASATGRWVWRGRQGKA